MKTIERPFRLEASEGLGGKLRPDVWIAATANVGWLGFISPDGKVFLPLRGMSRLDVDVIDPKSGALVP